MSAYETKPFDSAIEPICMRIKELPLLHQQAINEIRLRVGRPVTLHTPTRVDILKHNGQPIVTEKQDIEESYRRICDFSIYSHQEEIKKGYITVQGGHRVQLYYSRDKSQLSGKYLL